VSRQDERTPGARPLEPGAVTTATGDFEALVAGQPQGDQVLERRLTGHGATVRIHRCDSDEKRCTGTLLERAVTLASHVHQLSVHRRSLAGGARPGELGGPLPAE
jgi:hypothetical protein